MLVVGHYKLTCILGNRRGDACFSIFHPVLYCIKIADTRVEFFMCLYAKRKKERERER